MLFFLLSCLKMLLQNLTWPYIVSRIELEYFLSRTQHIPMEKCKAHSELNHTLGVYVLMGVVAVCNEEN